MTNREEVAERIREGGIARNVSEAYVLLLYCIGIRPQLPAVYTYKLALERLADLIDPTCHVEEVTEDDKTLYVCSNCGDFKCTNRQSVDVFNYCPVCGARVVRDEA